MSGDYLNFSAPFAHHHQQVSKLAMRALITQPMPRGLCDGGCSQTPSNPFQVPGLGLLVLQVVAETATSCRG